jgi:hypothetical protein
MATFQKLIGLRMLRAQLSAKDTRIPSIETKIDWLQQQYEREIAAQRENVVPLADPYRLIQELEAMGVEIG